ncbi:MAG TPA: phosphosulfolactate synthase [Puia sp.]|jgi:phosphosulfolactate synthase|nr:phosphosulfolactate synthase [Puia sp.]
MNFNLTQIPERTRRPRNYGLTMINDKGLSVGEARNLVSGSGPHVDLVKLAFGTSLLSSGLHEKIRLLQDAGIPVYFGGLLLEAYIIRNQFNDYLELLKEYNITWIEMSDGSIDISHAEKCGYIEKLAKYGTVLSEVGSKDKDREHITPPYQWIRLMQSELGAGASYIVAEARETGTVGLYRDSGEVREGLVQEILTKVPAEKILWEAPRKDQQLYFLKLIGANANLGNINPSEVIALEAMRIGLRGDTFDLFLSK